MDQIKSGSTNGKRRIPQKNNPNLGKETSKPKTPKWLGVVRKIEKIAREKYEERRESRGSQTRLPRFKGISKNHEEERK